MSQSVLNKIVADRRLTVERDKQNIDVSKIPRIEKDAGRRLSLREAINQPGLSLIAEIKAASPSRGVIKDDFDVGSIAKTYEAAGARAISVLTEPNNFNGRWEYLRLAKESARLPIMCKDFIIDRFQLRVAKAQGADAALLIAAVLDDEELARMIEAAHQLGLEVLTEAINRTELDRVLSSETDLVGINNRNLHSLEIDLNVSFELLQGLDQTTPVVVESGIFSRRDAERLENKGADGILVGTAIMQSDNMAAKIKELVG